MTVYLKGQRAGTLTILEPTDRRSQRSIIWKCLCDCGEEVYVAARELMHTKRKAHRNCPLTTSNRELASIWNGIKQRCYNPSSAAFSSYGGRGITMCPEWKDSYLAFERDVGPRPSAKHSIDRIDVNGNYTPENCRWADASVQSTNQRARPYDHDKKLYTLLTHDSHLEISRVTGYAMQTICLLRMFKPPESYSIRANLGYRSLEDIKRDRLRRLSEVKQLKEKLLATKSELSK